MTPESYQLAEPTSPESGRVSLPEPLQKWNDTRTDFPRDKSVAQLFEETAAAHPNATAVVLGTHTLTYAELNRRANNLAHRLRQMGVGPEVMVGCCLERSLDLIVALVAVLKAGGAYVPLDASYPRERFDLLLEDTHTPVMITQKSLAANVLHGRTVAGIVVDDEEFTASILASTLASPDSDQNPAPAGGPTSLAYVMYTSGSTGRPKGVMVENRAIVRLVRNTDYCRFGPEEAFLQYAPISFDASTLEIWGPLLNGGRLVLMPPQASSLVDLGRTIRDQHVTAMWLTAGLFSLMVEQRLEDLAPVRQLLAGGDVLPARHVRLVLEAHPGCTLINGYGPTENTTFTCCHVMRSGDLIPDSVPIGRPISNTRVYILDESGRPVPQGDTGELYAAGDGVARGYLNSPDATAEKFVRDPFAADASARMYRTGDLARWRADGTVEFLGRIDTQVKILGYRIEPGEIEAALLGHVAVRQVCVIPHTDESGSKRLVAYYVAAAESGVAAADLKKFLAEKLPAFMVPALFVPLEKLPLTPNGKIDRAALPAPGTSTAASARVTTTAELTASGAASGASELEQNLMALWKRILRVEQVGLDDNFFDIGGDSLLLVAVHSNLQKTLQIEIPVTDLFEFTTVRTLARRLGSQKAPAASPSLSDSQLQAQRQRDAFARQRQKRGGGSGDPS
jgi:amino acid adenylation domain-containing protein